jgi:hypothetical protein
LRRKSDGAARERVGLQPDSTTTATERAGLQPESTTTATERAGAAARVNYHCKWPELLRKPLAEPRARATAVDPLVSPSPGSTPGKSGSGPPLDRQESLSVRVCDRREQQSPLRRSDSNVSCKGSKRAILFPQQSATWLQGAFDLRHLLRTGTRAVIQQSKQKQALHAINAVVVQGRTMAYEKAGHTDLAHVFDTAEYLLMLMLDDRDATSHFREVLGGLAGRFPTFKFALERFDAD